MSRPRFAAKYIDHTKANAPDLVEGAPEFVNAAENYNRLSKTGEASQQDLDQLWSEWRDLSPAQRAEFKNPNQLLLTKPLFYLNSTVGYPANELMQALGR